MGKARYEVRLGDTKGYTEIVTVWSEAIERAKLWFEPQHDLGQEWAQQEAERMVGSPHPTWRRLRERLRGRDIDPFDHTDG